MAGITRVERANEFLNGKYVAEFNANFSVKPAEPGTAFVSARGRNLDLIFSIQHERVVGKDNTVSLANQCFQIERTKWRNSLAGCRVTIYELADGTVSVSYGPHSVGHYNAQGVALLEPTRKRQKVA